MQFIYFKENIFELNLSYCALSYFWLLRCSQFRQVWSSRAICSRKEDLGALTCANFTQKWCNSVLHANAREHDLYTTQKHLQCCQSLNFSLHADMTKAQSFSCVLTLHTCSQWVRLPVNHSSCHLLSPPVPPCFGSPTNRLQDHKSSHLQRFKGPWLWARVTLRKVCSSSCWMVHLHSSRVRKHSVGLSAAAAGVSSLLSLYAQRSFVRVMCHCNGNDLALVCFFLSAHPVN